MTWTYELEQKKDKDGNLLPLWKVKQWNTNNDKIRWETERLLITQLWEAEYK